MKKIVYICVLINIVIFSVFGYYLFIKESNDELIYMLDVVGESKYEAINLLENYEIEIIELDSNETKDTVIFTEPKVNELTQVGQIIKLYVSTGDFKINYENLVNKYYEDYIDYLNNLEKMYNINVVVENQISDDYPNSTIIYQSSNGYIKENDTFIIKVNYNNPLILIPNLIGKTEKEVIDYFKNYDIILHFIYEKNNDNNNIVFKQSINENSLVLKDTVLYIYISI